MSLEAMRIRQKIAIWEKKRKLHRRNFKRMCHLNFVRRKKKVCTLHFSKAQQTLLWPLFYAVNSGSSNEGVIFRS